VSLGLFVATNLLAATSQRRYAIKRSEGPWYLPGGHSCDGSGENQGPSLCSGWQVV